jgi:Dolichyl-phosphate-mannose-protein mannosyltransferase
MQSIVVRWLTQLDLTREDAPLEAAMLGRTWSPTWRARVLVGLFLIGLAPRLALLAARADNLEFWEYEALARNIAAGNGYVITRFGHLTLAFGDGNLYSFVAGTLYAVVGHAPLALALLHAMLAALIAPVIFAIGERALGGAVATLGAGLAAVHPGLLAYTLKLHPLGLDVLLLALVLYWTTRPRWTRHGTFQTGLTLGLNLMTRPTFFLAGLAALSIRWLTRRASMRQTVAVLLIALAVGAPWITRNWLFVGRPLLISTAFEDVWKGNNPMSSGSGFLAPGRTSFDAAPPTLIDRIWHSDELQLNDLFVGETISFVRDRPGQFASLAARKFAYFWWLPDRAGALYPSSWLTMYQVYAMLVYTFAAVGTLAILRADTRAARHLVATLAATGLTLAVVHALSYVDGRHRWGIEPLFLLLTGRGILASAGALRTLAAWNHSRVLLRRGQSDR